MYEKLGWPQNIINFLVDNFFTLLTIFFASFIIYRQTFVVIPSTTNELFLAISELLTGVLAVLSLLAGSEIVERYRKLHKIEQTSQHILSLLEGKTTARPSALSFFHKPPNLDNYLAGATQIDLCGVTLTATINKQFSTLREKLIEGAQINVLIVDPDSLALNMAAARSESPNDVDYFRKRLETTFADLEYLYKNWLGHHLSENKSKGHLAIRLMPYAPSFGIISLNVNRISSVAIVEIYPHIDYGTQPAFELTPQRDGEWHKYYVNQFSRMWESAKPWVPVSRDKDLELP